MSFRFPFGDSYVHSDVPWNKIEINLVPENPGLYSWHLQIPSRRTGEMYEIALIRGFAPSPVFAYMPPPKLNNMAKSRFV